MHDYVRQIEKLIEKKATREQIISTFEKYNDNYESIIDSKFLNKHQVNFLEWADQYLVDQIFQHIKGSEINFNSTRKGAQNIQRINTEDDIKEMNEARIWLSRQCPG